MNEKVKEYSKEKAVHYIYCHSRDVARAFYEKCGFQVKGDFFEEVGIKHWYMYINLD